MSDEHPSAMTVTATAARLRVAEGADAGRCHSLPARRATVGRGDDADLKLPDNGASKLHAAFAPIDGGRWRVEDLGSRNGTQVNGARIAEPRLLATGDRVRVGSTELEFLAGDGDARLLRDDGRDLPLVGGRVVVGRAGGGADLPDVVLLDDKASRQHCAFAHDDGGWTVEDLGSRNGTQLDGQPLEANAPKRLRDGSALVIGRTRLRFAIGGSASSSVAPAAKPAQRSSVAEPTPLAAPRVRADARARPDTVGDVDDEDSDEPVFEEADEGDSPRREPGTRAVRRRSEVIDARTVVREFGLPRPVLIGVAILAIAVVLVVFGVPALDRALNGDERADERAPAPAPHVPRDGAPRALSPAPREPVRDERAPAPTARDEAPEPSDAASTRADLAAPSEPAAAPVEPTPSPEPSAPRLAASPAAPGALDEPAPPTADARAPALAPQVVAATYVGSGGVADVAITAKGSIVARARDAVAAYDAGGAHGALAPLDAADAPAASGDDDSVTLRLDGVTWRFAALGGAPRPTPTGAAGEHRWWHPEAPCADDARPLGAWAAPDGLVLTAWRVSGGDSLVARDPRDATRPDPALAHGWAPTASGEATLLLLADATGAPRAASYVPGPAAPLAVDASGRVYVGRRLADPSDEIGLGGGAGVSVLSADLRRVVGAWAVGAADGGDDERVEALAVRDGVLALGGVTRGRRLATTPNAVQAKPAADGACGFAAIIRLW